MIAALAGAILAAFGLAALAACLAGAAGLALFRDPFASLHCASLAAITGPAGAVLLAAPFLAGDAARLVIIALLALASGGIGTHALARAIAARRGGAREP